MIHLNVRSGFSFLRAYGTPEQIVARAKAMGATGVGIADYCSTWAHIPLQKACRKADIAPFMGLQLPVVFDAQTKEVRYDLVTLMAKDEATLQLIYSARTKAEQQKYYRPRLTWAQVEELDKAGVMVIVDHLRSDDQHVEWVLKQGYACALSPTPTPLNGMIRVHNLPPIAAYGPIMPSVQDREALNTILSISDRQRIGEVDREPIHMTTEAEYGAVLRSLGVPGDTIGRAVAANREAAEKLRGVSVPPARNIQFPPDDLGRLIVQGITARWGDEGLPPGGYRERLDRELKVIHEKGFGDYFVFVGRLVGWAKERMFVGPGRGSSGGSLLCYILGITEVDPIVHGTLFERFIDITRPDWPDIDVDFPDIKRSEVLEYLFATYGKDKVAKLGTISEFQQKSALNDVARAIGVPFEEARMFSRLIENAEKLEDVEDDPGVRTLLEKYPNFRRALNIEGHPRHHGVHAAGLVVSADPINRVASVSEEGVAACTMKDAEDIGLLKMDALGLTTLSIIEACCYHASLDPAYLYSLPLDDDAVFDLFRRDKLTGIFQFEGHTVRGLTRGVKVQNFYDLCAITSLARPGPLEGGGAKNWVRRRNGDDDVTYEHELLEPLLNQTMGVIVYQEQMMNIVRSIADFSEPDVNRFRRAIGKKLPEELKKFAAQFFENAKGKVGEAVAKSLWHQMEESGSYAFNYSHAVAYSMLSYITAYLKVHYPLEFSLAQLQNSRSEEQTRALLQEMLNEGQDVVVFDKNISLADWSVQNGRLVGGFSIVKGVGIKTAHTIVAKREENPNGWTEQISPGIRAKIEDPRNWEWADVGRISRHLTELYRDPASFRSKRVTQGVVGKPIRIADIGTGKGSYVFAGLLTRKQLRNSNDADRAAKRGGQRLSGPTNFLNLYLDDGSGDIGCTISRFKYEEMGNAIWNDPDAEGKLFLVRGSCINDSGRWIFVDKIVDISDVMEKANGNVTEPAGTGDHTEAGALEGSG